jgi:lycopene cyclase domain-containing protein
MWLYSILLVVSFSIPFILSFDKKLQFYKSWKYIIPSLFLIAIFYIAADVLMTSQGVWGFNPQYHSNIILLKLPIEEWLFFIVIPYASIFLHQSIALYFPWFQLTKKVSRLLTVMLITVFLMILILHFNKAYTLYITSTLILTLMISLFDKTEVIRQFYLSYLVILIPFIAVNAIFTGSFIHREIVWYDNTENLGIRFLTIPIEDFGYAFSLILLNLMLTGRLKQLFKTMHKN